MKLLAQEVLCVLRSAWKHLYERRMPQQITHPSASFHNPSPFRKIHLHGTAAFEGFAFLEMLTSFQCSIGSRLNVFESSMH